MITEKQVLKYAKKRGYDKVEKYDIVWNGYEVWHPSFNGNGVAIIGFPLVILVKGNEIRMSTPDESIEVLKLRYPGLGEEDEED